MTNPVQIAHAAPTMASTAAINERQELGNRVIVVHPTPGSGGEGIARDVLQALGKRFRDRSPRDPQRLRTLAGIWLRAEQIRELVIAGADRRPAADWRILHDLCRETLTRLTFVVERRPTRDQRDALCDDVCELALTEFLGELPPPIGPGTSGIFDESGSPDERPGYPPVPDVDFVYFPSACTDLLPEHDAARVLRAFERGRTMARLWFELRRGFEPRHGPGPRHAHAFLDTLVAPCVLRTPPGQSEYLTYRDTDADPPTLVCIVGKTTLGYQLRCLEDLHAMLARHGDWIALGTAGEEKAAAEGTVEAWGRSPENPVGGWYGVKKGLRGRFANYVPPVMEHLGLAELEHNPRNNRMRAR